MKKILSVVCAAALTACTLVGCGSSAASSAPAASAPAAAAELTGKITTGGSTSMEKVLAALQESFNEANPGVDITYDPTGSGAGITGAQEGRLDIGLASRDLKDGETGVTSTTIALDGIAIIVNAANPVSDLSVEQIGAMFRGEITNWSEVGGNDAEIVLIGREAGSGTRDGFESITDTKDACKYVQELTATGAVISAVESNEAAIGYASLAAVDDSTKTLTVGGIECSEATVKDGSYAVQRPFNFITNDSAEQSEAVKAFIEYTLSPEAADMIRLGGAVPLA